MMTSRWIPFLHTLNVLRDIPYAKGSKEFYFLGQMHPTGHFVQTMTIANENAVEIGYQLETPVRRDIYEYITSVFVEGDET